LPVASIVATNILSLTGIVKSCCGEPTVVAGIGYGQFHAIAGSAATNTLHLHFIHHFQVKSALAVCAYVLTQG
jgi:hypothetical protein